MWFTGAELEAAVGVKDRTGRGAEGREARAPFCVLSCPRPCTCLVLFLMALFHPDALHDLG